MSLTPTPTNELSIEPHNFSPEPIYVNKSTRNIADIQREKSTFITGTNNSQDAWAESYMSPTEKCPESPRRSYSHLPTPQSPTNFGQYRNVRRSPESPLSYRNYSTQNASSSPFYNLGQRAPEEKLEQLPHYQCDVYPQQMFTPESSPSVQRNGSATQLEATPPFKTNLANVKIESTGLSTPVNRRASFPSSSSSSIPTSRSSLSSPFMARTPFPDGSLPQPIDVFSSEVTILSTPPNSPFVEQAHHGGEMERIRQDKLALIQEAENRRPDYFKRAKRTLLEVEFSEKGEMSDHEDKTLPGIEITASPNKGRRIQLFQETSEESFEESLMAGGYGRYRTADWLQQPQPIPGPAGPSNVISLLEAEAAPSEKDLKRHRRLAAFRQSGNLQERSSKIHAVEVAGFGRVLSDSVESEAPLSTDLQPVKKRANRRRKRGMDLEASSVDTPLTRELWSETSRPDWPDSEFPWRLRSEERAHKAKVEEAERLRWIQNFLDRDTDEEDDENDELLPATGSRGRNHTQSPLLPVKGRGKMVPLHVQSDHLGRETSTFFSSDPADARAALLSKRSVRMLSYRHQLQVRDEAEGSDEEVLCICNGRDDGRELVQCDGCQTWYHLQCIGINSVAELGREEDPWYCRVCVATSRTPSPRPRPSVEPMFVPTDVRPTNSSYDVPFFQSYTQNSPLPTWNMPQHPTTPARVEDPARTFSSGSSKYDPSTPSMQPHPVRIYTTHGQFDNYGLEEPHFDPTSTPSRGIALEASFSTPKANIWSTRAQGSFSTPMKAVRGSSGKPYPGGSASLSSLDTSAGNAVPSSSYRSLPSYDDSPIRRSKTEDGMCIFESPLASKYSIPFPLHPTEYSLARTKGINGPQNMPT